MKQILLISAALFAWATVGNAQTPQKAQELPKDVTKSLMRPFQWKDANTLLLAQYEWGRDMTYYEMTVKPFAVTPGQAPEKHGDRPDYGLDKEAKNPTPSPDGKWVAYTYKNDLYAKNLETGNVVRHTTDGSEVILNGWASWVYYEEILGRGSRYCSFWWSPDSRTLAFFRCDDSNVPMFPIYVSEGQHGYVERTRYPKAGDPNPTVRVGLVPADGSGSVVWADFDEKEDQYFGQPYWTPDSGKLWLQWMNRDQTQLKLYAVSPKDGAKEVVYEENQTTWLDWIASPKFVDQGLLMVRDVAKWQQVYFCPWDGSGVKCLTSGHNWGLSILDVDAKANVLYYMARGEISTRYDVYAVNMPFGKKKAKDTAPRRLTKGDYSYSGVSFSPDFKYFVATRSNVATPTVTALYDVKTGTEKVLDDSKGPQFETAQANGLIPKTEMHFITTEDGFTLPATITWPLQMDPNKKYPVIVSIYGGPDAGTVMDAWASPERNFFWAQKGVIQVSIDHRGSGHCGKAGLDMMHRCLGKWEMHDYKLWIDYLRTFPCVNPAKVGITGYSYGGYITAYAVITEGDYFPYGIAGAGVYDWTLYDSHYTERFMDTPQDNPEGYKNGSVVRNAEQYGTEAQHSVLYLTHGTSDDNVHFQNSVQLVDALMKNNKHFDYMLYPAARHGYRGYQSAFSNREDIDFWTKYLLDE